MFFPNPFPCPDLAQSSYESGSDDDFLEPVYMPPSLRPLSGSRSRASRARAADMLPSHAIIGLDSDGERTDSESSWEDEGLEEGSKFFEVREGDEQGLGGDTNMEHPSSVPYAAWLADPMLCFFFKLLCSAEILQGSEQASLDFGGWKECYRHAQSCPALSSVSCSCCHRAPSSEMAQTSS